MLHRHHLLLPCLSAPSPDLKHKLDDGDEDFDVAVEDEDEGKGRRDSTCVSESECMHRLFVCFFSPSLSLFLPPSLSLSLSLWTLSPIYFSFLRNEIHLNAWPLVDLASSGCSCPSQEGGWRKAAGERQEVWLWGKEAQHKEQHNRIHIGHVRVQSQEKQVALHGRLLGRRAELDEGEAEDIQKEALRKDERKDMDI